MSYTNTNTDILIAGAFAAFAVDILVYPLDTIKTRIQSPNYERLYVNASTKGINRSLFRGLYQGIGSVVIATLPSCSNPYLFSPSPVAGAFFMTYEGTKSFLNRVNPKVYNDAPFLPTPVVHSLASSTGELVSCFILTPAEVLKQNAQVVVKSSSQEGSKIFDRNATLRALRRFDSPLQLWRGYTALAARNLPFTAMHFPMFEYLKGRIQEYRKEQGSFTGSLLETATTTAISAGAAGSLAAIITTPIDVIKTQIMLSAADKREPSRKAIQVAESQGRDAKIEIEKAQQAARGGRVGGFAVGKEIWRTAGIRGLFRGGALRGLWTILGSGLYLGAYESGRRYLEEGRKDAHEGVSAA